MSIHGATIAASSVRETEQPKLDDWDKLGCSVNYIQ